MINIPSTANLTSAVFRDSGYIVNLFTTGEEGIEAFRKNTYHLVLTNILLKGRLNGHGIVKAIRHLEDESKKYVPLLVFSVLDDVAHKVELLAWELMITSPNHSINLLRAPCAYPRGKTAGYYGAENQKRRATLTSKTQTIMLPVARPRGIASSRRTACKSRQPDHQ